MTETTIRNDDENYVEEACCVNWGELNGRGGRIKLQVSFKGSLSWLWDDFITYLNFSAS